MLWLLSARIQISVKCWFQAGFAAALDRRCFVFEAAVISDEDSSILTVE